MAPRGPRKSGRGRPRRAGRDHRAAASELPPAAPGERLVYGLRPVEELLRARPDSIQALFMAEGRRSDPALQAALDDQGLTPVTVAPEALDRLSQGENHQGLLAVVGGYAYVDLAELLAQAGETPGLPLVVLDQVQDPRNLGAILRSAEVLGCAGVILPGRRAVGVTPVVVRTAAGATEHLAIARVTNLSRSLGALKEAGWWLVGAAGEGGQAPEVLDLVDRVALVMGSEGRGLRPSTREHCDFTVAIPMQGQVGSLNVAVAAGIVLAEAARQRRHQSDGTKR